MDKNVSSTLCSDPMITNFEIDGIDPVPSEANLITMDITYENFAMQPNHK